jgi:hypothetical protein
MNNNISNAIETQHAVPVAVNRRNPLNLLILVGILLIAAIAVGTSLTIVSFRQRALMNSGRELQNTVLLLSRHFDRELDNFDAVQRDLIQRMQLTGMGTPEAFKRQISGENVHQVLQTLVSGVSDNAGINIYDANGQLINSSLFWPIPTISVADRAYFKKLRIDPRSPPVIIEALRSRFSGGWTTVIVRKVVGPDGTFLGAVSRGMPPAGFEAFFESLALGEGAAISMLHRDGTLLARYPHVEPMIGRNFSTSPIQKILETANHGTVRAVSPIDGEERLASTHALSNFPLQIVATTKVSTALADWREQTRFLIGAAGLAALAIAITLLLIVRKLSKQHQNAERRLALEKERLDTAVNNMTQACYYTTSTAGSFYTTSVIWKCITCPPKW